MPLAVDGVKESTSSALMMSMISVLMAWMNAKYGIFVGDNISATTIRQQLHT